jgi:hypothetical protein
MGKRLCGRHFAGGWQNQACCLRCQQRDRRNSWGRSGWSSSSCTEGKFLAIVDTVVLGLEWHSLVGSSSDLLLCSMALEALSSSWSPWPLTTFSMTVSSVSTSSVSFCCLQLKVLLMCSYATYQLCVLYKLLDRSVPQSLPLQQAL